MDKFLEKREKNSMDKLLPDDVLTHIVSLLPLKEAGRTSLIGRPWRNIWKFINILKFDGKEKLDSITSAAEVEVERQRFVDWVNRVVSLHCGECIEEFNARFDLDMTHAHDIDRWIEFALRKRVCYLELFFSPKLNGAKGRYSFPNVRRYMNNSPSLVLVSLSLIGLVLSQENLESFMANCPNLGRLSLARVKGFTIVPQATRLRRLRLVHCRNFERIQTLSDRGSSLYYLVLGVCWSTELLRHLDDLSGYLFRLETLDIITRANVEITMKCQQLPRLKKLVLQMNVVTEAQILNLVGVMINAAPLLQKIVLKLLIGDLHVNQRIPEYPKEDEQRKKHECLKEVEILGGDRRGVPLSSRVPNLLQNFAACDEVALYVLECAPKLQKLVIDGVFTTLQQFDSLRRELLSRGFRV